MKNIGKLAVLGAVLAASASYAFADTVVAASYGSVGYAQAGVVTTGNTAMTYVGDITFASIAAMETAYPYPAAPTTGFSSVNTEAVQVNPQTPTWNAALNGSSWVALSAAAGPSPASGPNTTVNPAYGFYEFTTTLTSAVTNGFLQVYADDTTEVLLNNSVIIGLGALGADSHCADNAPTCTVEATDTISYAAGSTLTFIVQQGGTVSSTGLDPSGVDFSITTTPEPSSLMLLGTGLVGAAGMFFRRRVTA